jgi:hypothetical protein
VITVVLRDNSSPIPPRPQPSLSGIMGAPTPSFNPIADAAAQLTDAATVAAPPVTEVVVAAGESFGIENGILLIRDAGEKDIALFAPGTWAYAYPSEVE